MSLLASDSASIRVRQCLRASRSSSLPGSFFIALSCSVTLPLVTPPLSALLPSSVATPLEAAHKEILVRFGYIGPQRREQVKEQGARSQPPPAMLAASASSGFASNRRQATQGVEHDLKKRYL